MSNNNSKTNNDSLVCDGAADKTVNRLASPRACAVLASGLQRVRMRGGDQAGDASVTVGELA